LVEAARFAGDAYYEGCEFRLACRKPRDCGGGVSHRMH